MNTDTTNGIRQKNDNLTRENTLHAMHELNGLWQRCRAAVALDNAILILTLLRWPAFLGLLLLCLGAARSGAPDPAAATYEQRIGQRLPTTALLTDQHGRQLPLAQRLNGQPAVLVLGYFNCEKLCHPLLRTVAETLEQNTPALGFRRLAVTIDADETPRQALHLARMLPGGEHWSLLTGSAATTAILANAVGFHYRYDAATRQFIHPAGIVFLSPGGEISSYLLGVQFTAADIEQALRRAGRSQRGSPVPDVLLRCYQFLSDQGRHSSAVIWGLRAAGVITLLALAGVLLRLRRPGAPR